MKIVTGNRLNEFWDELKGVFVPKSKVLKTMEEIEANTNEENVAGATALKAVNNKLGHGRVEIVVINDCRLGYKLDGADTVIPFINNDTICIPGNIILYGYRTGASNQSDLVTTPFTLKIRINKGIFEIYSNTAFISGEYPGGWRGKVTFGNPSISK